MLNQKKVTDLLSRWTLVVQLISSHAYEQKYTTIELRIRVSALTHLLFTSAINVTPKMTAKSVTPSW
jgi:hypothetical protein